MRILLVFLDGVGLGGEDASTNVFAAHPTPALSVLLDGRRLVRSAAPISTAAATLVPLDACFGVEGLPQSGTGQTALFTGIDAVALYGRHFGPWVPSSLRPVLREQSILARARRAGRRVAFANAYPEEVVSTRNGEAAGGPIEGDTADSGDPADAGSAVRTARARRASRFLSAGPPLAALGAGVLVRHTAALMRGEALASEITNDSWKTRLGRTALPDIGPREAGHNLSRIVADHDLTLFAHYGTDYAGHSRSMENAIDAVDRVDAFLEGVLETLPDDALVIVSSDHGNIEDVTGGHTRNPAIGLLIGAGHRGIGRGWTSLLDVAPTIMALLEGSRTDPRQPS